MVMENEELHNYVETLHFNMNNYMSYVAYQLEEKHQFLGKWTLEEYGLLCHLRGDKVDISDPLFQEEYCHQMGFDDVEMLPDYCSFERYCMKRNLECFDTCHYPLTGYLVEMPKNEH